MVERRVRGLERLWSKSWLRAALKSLAYTLRPRHTRQSLIVWATIIFVGIGGGIVSYNHVRQQQYSLESVPPGLLVKSPVKKALIKQTDAAFTYNRTDEISGQPKRSLTVSTDSNQSSAAPYQAIISRKAADGIAFGDASGDMTFKMLPRHALSAGRLDGERVVYPEGLDGKHVYTYMRNGLKEDIILESAPGDTAQYSWNLQLGAKLDARLLADGTVGIYSANPYLYNDLQIADSKSQELIDKARASGERNNLAFVIPKPYIKDAEGHKNYADVTYSLTDNGKTLTLQASNLMKQSYPLSIDPSVAVTSTTDFRIGYDDGMIDYASAGQIGRSSVSIGTTSAYTALNTFANGRRNHVMVAYNGYIYIIGGSAAGSTVYGDVQKAAINADGTIGTFTATSSLSNARTNHQAIAYNGYMYVLGGFTTTATASVERAVINPNDGTLGTFTAITALPTTRTQFRAFAYNGFVYITGGYSNGTLSNSVDRAAINADGTFGSFSSIGSFTNARWGHTSLPYNNYLYVIGGVNGSGLEMNDVQFAAINDDGSIGTFATTSAYSGARSGHGSVAYDGYMYVAGGNSSGGVQKNDVQKAQINADGTLGTFSATTSFTTARESLAYAAYNGYLYLSGGYDSTGTAYLNDVRKAAVNFGSPTAINSRSYTATTALPAARSNHAAVAYNGYLYVIGGNNGTSFFNDVLRAPINNDGTIGSFTTAATLSTILYDLDAEIYNGYLYLIGGANGTAINNGILVSRINSDGTLAGFSAANSYTDTPASSASAVYNGYLYILGGFGNTGTGTGVLKAPINSDGSLGTFAATTSFTTARYRLAAVAYNGFMYIIGGDDTFTTLSDIQKAPINSDGSLGTFAATTSFTTARAQHMAKAFNGYLLIIGGSDSGGNSLTSVQKAPINADGTIGTFVADTALPSARAIAASAFYGGNLFITGGLGTAHQPSVYVTQPLSIANQGTYERLIDLTVIPQTMDSVTIAGKTVCGARVSFRTAGSSGVLGTTTTLPNYVAGQTISISQASQRYVWIRIGMTDSTCGTNSNVTDITVNYTVTPPAAPTLSAPANNATGQVLTPTFQLRATDPENDFLKYKIDVCSTSNCSSIIRTIDQTSSQTGWTGQDQQTGTAYTGSSTLTSSTLASHTYQSPPLTENTQYWWRAYATDPGGSNTFSAASAINTFTTSAAPAAPTLSAPTANAINTSTTPTFQLRTTDANNDYLRYKIEVCSTSNCSSIVRTIDQTASQTGWTGQNQQTATAYTGSSTLASSTLASHTYQATALSAGTQFWWRAYGIDPGGSNTFGPASSIQSFTTATPSSAPAAPTLQSPASGVTGVGTQPQFRLSATDAQSDALRYKIEVCSNNTCSSIVQTIDQTASQAGWLSQDAASGTSYVGSTALAGSTTAVYNYQFSALSANTQYWWRAYAIDPSGSNTFSTASAISTFTTTASTNSTSITGGTTIRGGSRINQ